MHFNLEDNTSDQTSQQSVSSDNPSLCLAGLCQLSLVAGGHCVLLLSSLSARITEAGGHAGGGADTSQPPPQM